jgi:predicted site-specific integrase-resolvase
MVSNKEINKVVIEHKDRLTRFNFEFLVEFFKSHNVEIEWTDNVLNKSFENELVEDMLSLLSSFSNKIYGKRSSENRKKKKLIEQQKEKKC